MKWLITGATGFVGERLIERLLERGETQINILTRSPDKAKKNLNLPIEAYAWNPSTGEIDTKAFDNVDVVIHLAGENVAEGRWSDARKKRILDSRVQSGQLLVDTIKKMSSPPRKLVSASAVGIYGDRGPERLNEESDHKDDFLADVCKQWENVVLNASLPQTKTSCLRVGVVLGPDGGALKKMLPPFLAGGGGNLGNGKQYMSWIHRDDLADMFIYVATKDLTERIFNATSPNPVTNASFTKVLGKVIKRPTLIPVPALAVKILFGEMSTILLGGQRVYPENIIKEGFEFSYAHLHDALSEILGGMVKGEYNMRTFQVFRKKLPEIFSFFSNEKNLEKITPPYLHFKVDKKSTEEIETGTIIDYSLKLHGIPFRWKSEISNFENDKEFTDIQLKGPYQKWEHTHRFIGAGENTVMADYITYKMPFGPLGKFVAAIFVKKDLKKIFEFRRTVMDKEFK